jgi:condensin complex subunit 3
MAQKNLFQDRLLRFLAAFVGQVRDQAQLDCVEEVLGELVGLSYAADHAARWRACQLVQCLMGGLPGEAAVADDVADAVQDAMLERLDDAKPNVRAAAVRALARLPMPDEEGDFAECPVTAALLELLAAEKSKEVRKAVLASLPAAPATTPHLLDRTRDEADDVRRVTYLAIAEKVGLQALGPDAGAALLRRGLADRAPAVAAAAAVLAAAWLDGACGGDPLELLRRLDVERHPEEAELAVRALVAAGRLDAVQFGRLAGDESVGLRADFATAPLLGAAEALFWRVICECLASEAASKGLAAASAAGANAGIEAAAAAERLEALEVAVPATVEEMVGVIAAHAGAGPAHRFAAGQLMALAARCVDFTDATGRRAAAALLEDVLTRADAGEAAAPQAEAAWLEAAALLLRKVHAAPAELADAMLGVLGRLHRGGGLAAGAADEGAWGRALRAAALLLEHLPTARPALASDQAFSLADLLHEVVQPAALHAAPAVRRAGVRCLGLYCLLEGIPSSLPAHLAVLRSYLASPGAPPAVRAAAAQALGDLALQRGAKALDALLPAAGTEGEAAEAPTVDLLLDALRAWQEGFAEAAAGGARRRAGGRAPPPAAAPAEAEAEAELGTALVEALARLVAVNEFRAGADARRGEATALEDGDVVRVLAHLLFLHFSPASEPAPRLRQCLAVFFERFSALSMTSQQFLATAALPAARIAAADDAAAGRRTPAAGPLAPQVLRFMAQLLQAPVPGADGRREPVGHEALAELLVGEVLGCAARPSVPRPYLAALCKLPLALPMLNSDDDTRVRLDKRRAGAASAVGAAASPCAPPVLIRACCAPRPSPPLPAPAGHYGADRGVRWHRRRGADGPRDAQGHGGGAGALRPARGPPSPRAHRRGAGRHAGGGEEPRRGLLRGLPPALWRRR